MLEGKILLTGGSGTLGKALIKRAHEERWKCELTVFSRDPMKHAVVRRIYPDVRFITGDVRDFNSLLNCMAGMDYVFHLAANKHIPDSEFASIDTYNVNVMGSENICAAAMQLNTPHVVGISTDKAVHPANAYGCSKMMMEKIFQEYSRFDIPTQFHLVRYGNVLESTGSVIEAWKNAVSNGQPIKITSLKMTRFWLSPSQAVDYVINSLSFKSGLIYVPMMPALSIGKLAEYALGFEFGTESAIEVQFIPIRPGEKMHETLVSIEEAERHSIGWKECNGIAGPLVTIAPTTVPKEENVPSPAPYTSDSAPELTKEELEELLND